MWQRTNLEKELNYFRNKRISSEDILNEVQVILNKNEQQRNEISERLTFKTDRRENKVDVSLLKSEQIFHISDIKKLCVTYRLRFLDSHYFKKPVPEEAVTKIRMLEKDHDAKFSKFKIVAPAKLMKLENADDPLLFLPIGNDYFYLIHKWGNDLHPFRKLMMWPYKCFENLVFTIFLVSIVLTAMVPLQLFNGGNEVTQQEYLLMFLFMFKSVGGIVLFYGFAKGKNFNNAIWNSKYYNA